ncbi:Glutamine amidotransferase-like class 1 domain-containing protein 1 [Holothuria leucospilota]|uniref:Glutamine amidotransferase-like class 1 domain-containing protein 1 n=1 Tax=Holothuria leucospilota TaxID=206669 RepID=A0A9Q1BGD2_HOLLE|nr:Glutamine amidotransferase-like class 1 domain-containing protein 1 [Holothuria leucospilota]
MAKSHCLIVLSAASQGVDAFSFIQSFKVLHPVFNIQLTSPNGKAPEFISSDETSQRWLNEFRGRPYSSPVRIDSVDASRYSALLIPDGRGALYDLVHNTHLQSIVNHFIKTNKSICAIGSGVAALCSAPLTKSIPWNFEGFSITATPIVELAKKPGYGSLPIIIEDFVKQNGGVYSASEPHAVHVIIDRFLITGQNEASTVTAVQNLILLCNLRQSRSSSTNR